MKSWKISAFGIDHLKLEESPTPEPGPGQVLIEVKAASLNYRDLLIVEGKYDPKLLSSPRIPASDGAGVVVAVGKGVTRVKVGDRVCGIFMQNWLEGRLDAEKRAGALGGDLDGMLTTHALLSEQGVVRFPDYLSFEEAATLPCAAVTAWSALVHAAKITAGQTVLIEGTGGVSIFALQLAKAMGARVLGTSSSDEKLERAGALGLDAGLNYRTRPDWENWVLEETEGRGADLIVEVGGAGTLSKALRAVRIGGTIAQIGRAFTQAEGPLDLGQVLMRLIQLKGIYVGSRERFEAMNQALAQNRIRPVIDQVFAFEQAPEALRRMTSAQHFGKLVVRIG